MHGEEIEADDGNWEIEEAGHGHWKTGVPGLKRIHVKSIRIDWDDTPPAFIAESRLRQIFAALRKGFDGLDRDLDSAELRLARVLDGPRI